MTNPIFLLATTSLFFLLCYVTFGYGAAYQIGYGAFTLMAAMISLTFLLLWAKRATPLAMGMAFGWAGASSVMGWWWLYNLLGEPSAMKSNPILLMFLSVYFSGAVMHFMVIERSFGSHGHVFVVPVALAMLVSMFLNFLM